MNSKICRFNILSGGLKFYESINELSEKLGKTVQHTTQLLEETRLVNNKFVYYYLDYIFQGKSQPHFKVKLPKRHIQRVVAKEKEEITEKLLYQLKNYYPEKFKGVEVYLINSEGKIAGLLESEESISKHFSIKLGTVKSRLNRIKDIDMAIKFGICKKSVFDLINK
jgi:hypothetical protein